MNDLHAIAPSPNHEIHLTDDQLDDHLIGDLAAAPAAHLAACAHCTARAAGALAPIASFQSVSLAWGERRSATAPVPAPPSAAMLWERRLAWSMATATCAVGLGLINATHSLAGFSTPSAAAPAYTQTASQTSYQTAAEPTAAQLSSDNQLLNTIDRELAASTDSPAALGLVSVSAPRSRTSSRALQD